MLNHLLLYDDNTFMDNADTFLLNSLTEDVTFKKHFNNPLIL